MQAMAVGVTLLSATSYLVTCLCSNKKRFTTMNYNYNEAIKVT